MTTGLFVTEERRRIALFSRPIWALADGLLVRAGNPMGLSGYDSVRRNVGAVLAVVRGQVQHDTALGAGIPAERTRVFDTYPEAAQAVREGRVDAYASVHRAHDGYIVRHPHCGLDAVAVAPSDASPAFGAFAFAPADHALRTRVDDVLTQYLGSRDHRRMAQSYAFSDDEIDRVAD